MLYKFSEAERIEAYLYAEDIQEDVRRRGNKRKDGTKGDTKNDYYAGLSEIAGTRLLLDQEPRLTVGNLKEPDFVQDDLGFHFRHTLLGHGGLFVRDRDLPKMGKYGADIFVLLVGDDEEMEYVGWMADPPVTEKFFRSVHHFADDDDGKVFLVRQHELDEPIKFYEEQLARTHS